MIPERLLPVLQPVLDDARPLAERFTAAGHRIYLVGGVVRDLLLGRPLGDGDIDLTTDARPDQTKVLVSGWADAVWTQGERFGTIGAKLDGREFEITTHRAEAYVPDSRKPEVEFADAVEADLSRRDFTVNAMALSLPDTSSAPPELIDPFEGAADLARGRLRTPLSPEVSFSDDPLRMMRAARFVAGYGLLPEPELVAAVKALAPRLEIVAPERIRLELDKLLVVDDPSAGLWFLNDTGLAQEFLPELPAMRLEQDPIHHHKDVLAHTIAVVAKTGAVDRHGRPNKRVRLAALLHDVGKPKTRSFEGGGVSFHHHEVVGARMARERMTALRYPNDEIDAVATLVYLHLRFHTYSMGWTDSAVRRFVRDAGDLLDELIELTRCDCTTRNQRKAERLSRRMDELEERIAALREQEELAAIRPDLDGRQVMDHVGGEPGRWVGEALDHLLELRLEEGPLGEEEAYRRLDAWWASRGLPPRPGGS
jgi:poly(A) polymerase